MSSHSPSDRIAGRAFKATIPVLLGYVTIGFAFGLLAVESGYPAWLAVLMSVVVFAGAAQFIAIGLFVAGAGLPEIAAVTFMVNARHAAYGLSLIGRFRAAGKFRPYLIFGLTDETFALLSSEPALARHDSAFMLLVTLFDQLWWVSGTLSGAVAGELLPVKPAGLDFALTALFIVLAIEQALRVREFLPFVVAAAATILAAFAFGPRGALVAGMASSLVIVALAKRPGKPGKGKAPC
ncbi:MAG: AzlC family ABC transporter permease [Spirochaetes bacterium]|nr:AzlC family ABC transporter permease [Spirochaetota bacterium]